MIAFLMILVLGLTVPSLAEEPPEVPVAEEPAGAEGEAEATPPAADEAGPPTASIEEALSTDDKPDADAKADEKLPLPDDIKIPESDDEALEQGGELVDAVSSGNWPYALVLVLGLLIFGIRRYLASKKPKEETKDSK